MKVDLGFWDQNGNYIEDIQEIEMLSVNEINLLQAQNEGLKKQNKELQEEIGRMQILINNYIALTDKYHQTLQEIKKIAEGHINTRMLLSDKKSFLEFNNIYKLITKAEEEK